MQSRRCDEGGEKTARKKKEKLKVELNLPKSDKTESNLWVLALTFGFVGIITLGFWYTASFYTTANGLPFFVNTYCGFNPNEAPDFAMNETCVLTRDKPRPDTWSDEWKNTGYSAQSFDVPGIVRLIGTHPPQDISVKGEVVSDSPVTFVVELRDKNDNIVASTQGNTAVTGKYIAEGVTNKGEDHEIWFYTTSEDPGNPHPNVRSFTFKVTVMSYDGVPEMMNNKSAFLGPEVMLGSKAMRPLIFLNFFPLGLLLLVYPASRYWDGVQNNVAAIEEKFPDFLRDLAEYWKGGLSMTVSVQTLTTAEYAALNDEVKKMSDQVSWGVPFEDVMWMFADRVGTPLVKRAISLISEANRAGGKISDILITAANDTREIKFLVNERLRAVASYKAVIWTSFGVFLGVIVVLAKVFIPAIASSNGTSGGDTQIGNMQIRSIEPLLFITVFYYGVTLQAVGNGSMAGLMATGRISTGFANSGKMLIVAMLAFNFVVFDPGLLGIPEPRGLNPSLSIFVPGG